MPRRGRSTKPKKADDPTRLSRIETVGAWLRLWTPPREAVVPPVPWRRIVLYGLIVAAILGGAAAYAIPRIDSSKEEAAERERAEAARRAAEQRRDLARSQRPQFGRRPRPARPRGPAAERAARRGLLAEVERSIPADARGRVARGELKPPAPRVTECVPAPSSIVRAGGERDLSLGVDAYDCLAVTSEIPATEFHRAGSLGHPFRAVVNFRRFAFAWCKTNPPAGERAVPDPERVVPLPSVCRLKR